MTHNELIDAMVQTIALEREVTREALRTGRHGKDRFMLSGMTGDQLESVAQFIVSWRLNG